MNRLRGACLLLLPLAGCGQTEPPMTTFAPKSDFAEWIHSLYWQVIGWDTLILAIVVVATLLALFRAVTLRSDEYRAMRWKALLAWVRDALVAATEDHQLAGLPEFAAATR